MAKKKPKTKRKRQGPSVGVDAHQRRQERLEARRQAKAEAEERARRRARRDRWIRRGVLVGIVGFFVWFVFLRTQLPSEIDGHRVLTFTESGEGDHRTGTVTYEMTPPVSGPHAAGAAPCGVHPEPIPNENMVHMLEHGAVGVLYEPALDPADVEGIEAIVSDYESHTFSAPFSGMQTPIAVVSWARTMRLDSLDAGAVRDYIDTFRERGPEDQDCDNTVSSPFEPTPTPTPSPTPTDGGKGGHGDDH